MFRRLGKERPALLFFAILALVICAGTVFVRGWALFDREYKYIPATPANRLTGPLDYLPEPAGIAAEADGVYYFCAPDGALCSWEGETVETLLPPGEFEGSYLYAENGVLYYSSRKKQGVYAYEPATGLSETVYDMGSVWYPVFWWTDADGYCFLTRELPWGVYHFRQVNAMGEMLESAELPDDWRQRRVESENWRQALFTVCAVMGDALVCIEPADYSDGSVNLYHYKTGEWTPLLPGGGEPFGAPIGFSDGKLILPQGDSLYWALDPQTGGSEVFARLDDPSLRLVSADGGAVYAVQNGDTLGLYRDGAFTPIGLADEIDCQAGDVLFVSGRADETFTGISVIDLTGDPDFDGVSQYAVLPDGTVYRLYCTS